MENLDEELKSNICSILTAVSDETIKAVIHALKHAGLESLSDLQFVQEDDLILALKPIQRRKLIKAWNEQTTSLSDKLQVEVYDKSGKAASKRKSEEGLKTPSKRSKVLQTTQSDVNELFQQVLETETSADDNNSFDLAAASVSSYNPPAQNTSVTTNSEFIAPPYSPSISGQSQGISEDGWTITSQSNDDRYPLEIPSPNKQEKPNEVESITQEKNWDKNSSVDSSISEYLEVETTFSDRSSASSRESSCERSSELSHAVRNTPCTSHERESLIKTYKDLKTNVISGMKELDKKIKSEINGIETDPESVIFPVPVQNNFPAQSSKCKSKKVRRSNRFFLLQIYAKYKREFSDPAVEKRIVWKKIADDFKAITSMDYNESECSLEIDEMKHDYERKKYEDVTTNRTYKFLNAARRCFEGPEHPKCMPTQSKGRVYFLTLLQVYLKYKSYFSSPNIKEQVKEQEIWTKISTEMKEKHNFDSREYQCQIKMLHLKKEYEDFKNGISKRRKKPYFYEEAQKAFENPGTPDYEMDEVENKYVPPHLRNTQNKLNEATISAKAIDRSNTVKVSNLSSSVKASDLQVLFMPFGTIDCLYTVKCELDKSKCFAYVTFLRQEDASEAMLAVDGVEFNKLILKVEWAES